MYYLWLRLTAPKVARAVRLSDGYSILSRRARARLYRTASRVRAEGAVAELGSHRGGSAVVLGLATTGRKLHLFDRWGDLPQPTERDGEQFVTYRRENIPEKLAALATVWDDCRQVLRRAGVDAVLHRGWFEETLPRYDGPPFALVHLDCDYYESSKLALAFVEEHAAPEGCVVLSDNYAGWRGEHDAVDEFVATRSIRLTELPRGGASFVVAPKRRLSVGRPDRAL